MPRIKRWFPVSHEINHSGTMRDLMREFGLPGLRVWLEILSIADRAGEHVDCTSKGAISRLTSAAQTKFKTTSEIVLWLHNRGCMSLEVGQNSFTSASEVLQKSVRSASELDQKYLSRVVNYWEYHRYEEPEPVPTGPNHTEPHRTKNKIIAPPETKPWPVEDQWLSDAIKAQWFLSHANGELLDFGWWEDVDRSLGGIDRPLIEREFAKMSAWFKENPSRKKTARGMRMFIRSWLEKAKNKPQGVVYGIRR